MGVRSRVIGILFAPRRNEFGSRTNTSKVEGRDVPEPEGLVPHRESIQHRWLLDDVGINEIDWNVDLFAGWGDDHEVTSLPFFGNGATPTDQTTAGPGMVAITNIPATTHHMQRVRLQLKWRLHTGVTVPREATCCGVLYVTLKGQ